MITSAPISPTARANARVTPERMPGRIVGSTIRRNTVRLPAPSDRAASSISVSSSCSTGCTVRTTNGSVTNRRARKIAVRVNATLIPIGDCGPYSARRTRPATIVGNANGRSMTALTSDFPRKSSRTSTHAVIVPSTAFRSAAAAASSSVSFSAATASGPVTAVQKSPSVEAHTRAAIGRQTTTDRNAVTKPRESASPALPLGIALCTASGALATSDQLLDPRHQPLVGIEPPRVRRAPAADRLVVDREGARARRILRRVLLQDLRVDGAEAILREQVLCGIALREADELLRQVLVLAVLQHRDRQLDQHRLARDHVLDVLAGGPRGERLALVGDQHVALAREERVRRVAAGGVLRYDVLEELLHVGDRLFVRLPEMSLREVSGEHVPLGRTGAERVRRHDLDAGADEVVPALDVFRVAVADGEDDDGVGCDPAVGLPAPALVDEPGVDEQVHVVACRQEDDVGGQPRGDRLRLVGRGAERLREGDVLAVGRRLPRLDDPADHRLRR